ncbi:MAG: alpha/beta hydrolase [Pseudomonadota bacterium]
MIRRRFADLPHGQLHMRIAGSRGEAVPLVMLHPSPGSSRQLCALIERLGAGRLVVAPDCPGNGDSDPLPHDVPEIDDFADAILEGLAQILPDGPFDLYGTHTGARLATSIALRHPAQVRRIVLDGFGVYSADRRAEILATYAPEVAPDQIGQHLMWSWHFARDQWIWFPWFEKRDDRRVPLDLPSAQDLHALHVEILKALETYHRSYRAAFRYDMRTALPGVHHKTLICAQRTDMIFQMLPDMAAVKPDAEVAELPGTATPQDADETARRIDAFLTASASDGG